MLQTAAGRGALRPPPFGPGEAAPSGKLYEEKKGCARIRTGPSLCLAESGWNSTCKSNTREGWESSDV